MKNFSLQATYVNKNNELEEISSGLTKYGAVIVIGEAGIGKTTLTKVYTELNPLNFSEIIYFNGFEFEFNEAKLITDKSSSVNRRTLTIIDGFDEIISVAARKRVLKFLKEGRKYGQRVILTSRPYFTEQGILANAYTLRLRGLNQAEALRLIRFHLTHAQLDGITANELNEILSIIHNNPLGIVLTSELINSSKVTPRELLKLLNEKLNYKNPIFDERDSKIILPKPPKIISDIKVINASLIDKVQRNPSFIYSMSSRQFEEFVADLFERDGYRVSLTKQTHDGGKDMFVVENSRLGKFVYYVECKKHSAVRPVGVRLVRELYGTVIADRATAGLLVTSSYFSDEAKEFTEQIRTQLSLMEFVDLKNWVSELTEKQNSR